MSAVALTGNLATRVQRNSLRARLGTKRGTAPVRRHSPAGDEVERHCRPMTSEDRRQYFKILDRWNEAHRGKFGVAPLTASTMRVVRTLLFQLMDPKTGWLDPALTWISKCANRAYETVNQAIRQLEKLNALVVQRRARQGDDPDGPKWVQDTNLYRFELPERVRTWWAAQEAKGDAKRAERAPEDDATRRQAADTDNAQAEQDWATDVAARSREAAVIRDLRAARRARGPGAARHLAQAEAAARALGVELPPESTS